MTDKPTTLKGVIDFCVSNSPCEYKGIPVEVPDPVPADVLFLTSSYDKDAVATLAEVMKKLEVKFSYTYTSLVKCKTKNYPFQGMVESCSNILRYELKKISPRLVVIPDELTFTRIYPGYTFKYCLGIVMRPERALPDNVPTIALSMSYKLSDWNSATLSNGRKQFTFVQHLLNQRSIL